MIDIEKVLKGLECCTKWDSCSDCPYQTPNEYDISECTEPLHKDALELLKEQDRLLGKQQKGIDKLQADYAELRHKFLEKTQIVRCKDCKHGSLYCTEDVCGETLIECNRPDLGDVIEIHGWKWFCADGEKRE